MLEFVQETNSTDNTHTLKGYLIQSSPPQLSTVATISLRRNEENLAVFKQCVVASGLGANHGRDVGDSQRAVDDLTGCESGGEGVADTHNACVSDGVSANLGPVRVGLAVFVGESEVRRAVFGVGRCNGGCYVAGLAVCEDADRIGTVDAVLDGNAIASPVRV